MSLTKLRIPAQCAVAITILPLSIAAHAEGGAYLGAAAAHIKLDQRIDGLDFDLETEGFQLVAGYQFGDYLGVEGGYLQLGDFSDTVLVGNRATPFDAKTDGLSVAARVRWPLAERVALTGKAGLMFWEAQTELDGISGETRGEDPWFGLGAEVGLGERLTLFGEWQRFEFDDIEPDVYTLGLSLRF